MELYRMPRLLLLVTAVLGPLVYSRGASSLIHGESVDKSPITSDYFSVRYSLSSESSRGLPNFTEDSHSTDRAAHLSYYQLVIDMRRDNEDKPDVCRRDLCFSNTTSDSRKGEFQWRATPIGTRHHVRCPYAVHSAIYAYRDCVLEDGNATWQEPVFQICPDPPLAEQMQKVHTETVTQRAMSALDKQQWIIGAVYGIETAIIPYPDQPLFTEDVTSVQEMLKLLLDTATNLKQRLSNEELWVVAKLFNFLLEHQLVLQSVERILDVVTTLSHMMYVEEDTSELSFIQSHLLLKAIRLNSANANTYPHGDMAATINITKGVYFKLHTHADLGDDVIARLAYMKKVYFYQPELMEVAQFDYADYADYAAEGTNLNEEVFPFRARRRRDSPSQSRVTHLRKNTSSKQRHYNDVIERRASVVRAESLSSGQNAKLRIRARRWLDDDLSPERMAKYLDEYRMNGPVWYARITHQTNKTFFDKKEMDVTEEKMSVSYSIEHEVLEVSELGELPPIGYRCGNLQHAYMSDFDISNCHENQQSGRFGCNCTSEGFFGLFFNTSLSPERDPDPPLVDIDDMMKDTLSEFFGFPFRWELLVASHVLRAVSLFCLLLTVLSFIVFSKIRRGAPTRILLHLCLVLIALLMTLYVTEQIAGSRLGCRVSNVLRYYLVMTSLMWNGVEAVNMYLMLVKIFCMDINNFVLKAAIAAYGIPAVAVGIILGVDLKNFDGFWTMDCEFRCQLKSTVMYFAYLLPMSAIILHNMVVFGMVMRVLAKHNKGKGRKSSKWLRLVGAIAILALLGLPWIFSAFGTIDAARSENRLAMMEGVFQVLFIVFISLQGFFIFIFHCARNTEVRQHWRSTVSSFRSSSVRKGSSEAHNPPTSPKSTTSTNDAHQTRF